jgi:Fur family peroxide stress response transcriptional regulator
MVSSSNIPLSQRLADSGLRTTPQRELVYGVLLDHRDHPTAEEVFTRAKNQLPSISLATVYNCLETLVSCHLIKQVHFERGPCRYCPNLTEHAHLHDQSDGKIIDIPLPPTLIAELIALLPKGYKVSAIDLSFLAHPTSIHSK